MHFLHITLFGNLTIFDCSIQMSRDSGLVNIKQRSHLVLG